MQLVFPGGSPPDPAQQRTIGGALEAVYRIQKMLLGPIRTLLSLGAQEFDLAALHTISRFDVARQLPLDGSISYEDLSNRYGLASVNLRRVLRHSMTNDLFREVSPGHVAHSVLSCLLAESPLIRATASMLCNDQLPAAPKLADALQLSEGASEGATPPSACELANHATRPVMEELHAKYACRVQHFDMFMKLTWSQQSPVQVLIDNYDWAGLDKAHVVDFGGGLGHRNIALARAFPDLSFTVQDLKSACEQGSRDLPPELQGRDAFEAHDFSMPQTLHGASVYMLRSILHSWTDDKCVKSLRNLTAALRPGARVVLNDYSMPAPGELPFMKRGGHARWT